MSLSFLTIVALLMWVVTRNDDDADSYVSVLQVMMSWPVLAFTIVLIALLMFSHDVAFVIRRIKRFSYKDASADVGSQPEAPESERPPILQSKGAAAGASHNNTVSIEEDVVAITRRDEVVRLQQEVLHWFHRYLIVFLSPATIGIVRQLGALMFIGEHIVGSGEPPEDFEFPQDNDIRLYLASGGVYFTDRRTFKQALTALARYDLIKSEDDYTLTERGKEFLRFLESKDGRDLLREVNETQRSLRS